jgi:hypothetical protein
MKRIYVEKNDCAPSSSSSSRNYPRNKGKESGSGSGSGQEKEVILQRPKQTTSYSSVQKNFTDDEIREKLQGYVALRTMEQKKYLESIPLYKTWIRYHNTKTNQFRTGGLLIKVNYPDYIVLQNTAKKISWSVQLDDNIIYIRDPKTSEEDRKEEKLKEKLLDLYKRGQLRKL